MTMKTSVNGIALIKSFEGLRLHAYNDGTGVWTIGYGHTKEVKPGQVITEAQAEMFLRGDLALSEMIVGTSVRKSLNQNQFDALVSLCFNIGGANFRGSTLLRKLNEGDYKAVPSEMRRWNHADGKVLAGLTRRRAAEADLWNKPDSAGPIITPPTPDILAPYDQPLPGQPEYEPPASPSVNPVLAVAGIGVVVAAAIAYVLKLFGFI